MPALATPGAVVTEPDYGDLQHWLNELERPEDADGAGYAPGSGVEPAPSAPAESAPPDPARVTAWVQGRVQGVGFRWWVRSRALELELAGVAENLLDGRVKVIAEGRLDACLALLELLEGPGAPGRVARVTYRWDASRGSMHGFVERLLVNRASDLGKRQLDQSTVAVGA